MRLHRELSAHCCPSCGQAVQLAAVVRWPEAARAWWFLTGLCAPCQLTDPPAHQRAGPTRKVDTMKGDTSTTGQAATSGQAQAPEPSVEQLGEGHITGNLTQDPEMRFTPSGRAVANLRLAYAPRIKDEASGRWIDGEPQFYSITVWGKQAERVCERLQRGDRIVAVGQWSRRTWIDREGQERKTVYLTAQDIGPSLLFRDATINRTVRNGLPVSGPPPATEDWAGEPSDPAEG